MLIVHLIMRNIDRKCYEAFEQEDDLRMHINNAHEGNIKFEIKICYIVIILIKVCWIQLK